MFLAQKKKQHFIINAAGGLVMYLKNTGTYEIHLFGVGLLLAI
jgi:hypothetical protein